MPLTEPTRLVLRKTWQPMDADAAAYISAVETADGQALEEKVKIAIDNFVVGCKADGIWSAIKASCILSGARTLNGALVPLAGGVAPTPYNFVAGDYNRKTGLVGDGSSKYLDSNRLTDADGVNNIHMAVYASTAVTSGAGQFPMYMGAGSGATNATHFARLASNGDLFSRNRSSASDASIAPGASTGLIAASRSVQASYIFRASQRSAVITRSAAASMPQENIYVFNTSNGSSPNNGTYSNARLAFYSIGESLDLALLDARVTDLINAFGAAIP